MNQFMLLFWLLVGFCYVERSLQVQKRVIGGKVADKMRWPNLVSIRDSKLDEVLDYMQAPFKVKSGHFCGGYVIAPRWIVTSASCFPDKDVEALLASGRFTRKKMMLLFKLMRTLIQRKDLRRYSVCWSNTEKCEMERKIKNIKIHPGYRLSSRDGNDIALIELDEPILNLPKSDIGSPMDNIQEMECKAAGWGLSNVMEYSLNYGDPLKEFNVNIISKKECGRKLRGKEICGKGDQADFCFFDLGGPLVCRNGMGEDWKLYGVISRGTKDYCDPINSRGIYTDVPAHLRWMNMAIHTEN